MAEVTSTARARYRRSLLVRGGIAVLLAVLANAVLVTAMGALALAPDFRALTLPPVVFLSALGAAAATATYGVLARYVSDVDRAFVRLAAVALVLSFVPDVALLAVDPAATVFGVVLLVVMHVVVALVAVGLLVYWGRGR